MPNETLLERVASKLGEPAPFSEGAPGSILTISGAQYAAQPDDDEHTRPTGFDPMAAVLFEAVVESAFLVANADGRFDEVERAAFRRVVFSACEGKVSEAQISALLADLSDLFEEDGLDKRVKMVAKAIQTREQALEVLRISGLIAYVSEGVSEVERRALDMLAAEFGLEASVVDAVLTEVESALAD